MINQRVLSLLTKLAKENEGVRGKFRLAAGLLYKGHLVATGVNSYKSHPLASKYGKNPEAIFLHAETDCIKNALKLLSLRELAKCDMYVVRIKNDGSYGNSKCCIGCARAIAEFGIRSVTYYQEDVGWVTQ